MTIKIDRPVTTLEDIQAERERIRNFASADPRLQNYTNFLFNVHEPHVERAEFIIMGMNPGEPSDEVRDEARRVRHIEKSSKAWAENCLTLLGTSNFALTEMIFWSSPNIPKLRERLGDLGPYLSFCRGPNFLMIDYHQPKAIVLPGLGLIEEASLVYGLERRKPIIRNAKGHRLIEHWERDGRPWLFTKHWSGAWGFSADEKALIRDYVAGL